MEEIDLKEFVMLFWDRKVSIILITIKEKEKWKKLI